MEHLVMYPLNPQEDPRVYRYFIGKNGQSLKCLERILQCRLELRDKAHQPHIKVHLKIPNYPFVAQTLDRALEGSRVYVQNAWKTTPDHVPTYTILQRDPILKKEFDRDRTVSPPLSISPVETPRNEENLELKKKVEILEEKVRLMENVLLTMLDSDSMIKVPPLHQLPLNPYVPLGYHQIDWTR